jgi:hypothetical protein
MGCPVDLLTFLQHIRLTRRGSSVFSRQDMGDVSWELLRNGIGNRPSSHRFMK